MEKKTKFLRFLETLVSLMVLLALLLSGRSHWKSQAPALTDLPPLTEFEEGNSKMESILYRMLHISINRGIEKAKWKMAVFG
jgi:hypothetical protein